MRCFAIRTAGILLGVLLLWTILPVCIVGAEPATEPTQPAPVNGGEVCRLRGRVIASTGGPAVEADVRLIKRPQGSFTLPLVPKRVRSDNAGEFAFDGLNPGTYLVYAFLGDESSRDKKFGFEKVVINNERQQSKPVELRLKPGVTLRLRVTSQVTGKPLPTAKVGFRWTDTDDDFRANDQGEIVVPGLTSERWHLEIAAPGHACDIRDVKLTAPDTVIDVSLAEGGEITGRVVNDQGEPLPGAKLGVQVEHQAMYTLDRSIANEKGEFRLQYLPIGTPLRLGISHIDFDRSETRLNVASNVPTDIGRIQLKRLANGGTITGQVVDRAGKPIADATIENQGTSSVNQNTAHPDADGKFTIEKLYVYTAKRVLLNVRAKGFAPRQIDISDNARDGVEVLRIGLEPGHRIRGRVLNHADQPIAGCRVSFGDANHANPLGGRIDTDAEGRFEFDSLPSDCPFAFYATGYSELEVPTLPLDQNDEVIVRLEAIGLIRGQVVDAVTRQPIREFNVRMAFPSRTLRGDKKSHGLSSIRINPGEDFIAADGRFELNGLTNGSLWDVIVRTKKYRPTRLVRVQAAPDSNAETVTVNLRPIGNGESIKVGGTIVNPDRSPARDVQVRLIGLEKEADAPRREAVFVPPADETGPSADPSAQYDEFLTAVTNTKGEFTFEDVPPGLAMQLVYWSDSVPFTRLNDLEAKPVEELNQLRLTHEKPVIVRATIDRQALPDATELWLHGTSSNGFRDRRIVLKDAQSKIEVSGVKAGIFHVVLLGKPEPNDGLSGGYRMKHIAVKNVTATAGETVDVTFDGNAQR